MNAPLSSFVLRERNFFESTDLAVLLFRRFLPVIAATFGACFALVSCVTLALLGPVWPWLPAVVVWWLKPLWERIVMAPVGLLFFNPAAEPLTLLGSLKRVFSRELFAGLTFFRVNFFLPYLLPVDMYERPDRPRMSERCRWLYKGISGQLFGLSLVFLVLDFMLFFSFFSGLDFFFSSGLFGTREEGSMFTDWVPLNLCWFASLLVTTPLYQLSAFALYINRRTLHEGWDLRLAFGKLAKNTGSKPNPLALVAIALTLSLFSGGRAEAAEAAETGASALAGESYEARLERIIGDKEFGETKQVGTLRFKKRQESEEPVSETDTEANPFTFFSANVIRFIALAAGSIAVVFIVVFLVRRQGKRQKAAECAMPADVRLSADDKRKFTMGLAQSLDAWERSDQRLSLACLYNVGIRMARTCFGIEVPESATEGSCLAILGRSRADADFVGLFARITKAWIRVSWSNRSIDDETFRQLYEGLAVQEGRLS